MEHLTRDKEFWSPENYYNLSPHQRNIFDNTYHFPASEVWRIEDCATWCTYKQHSYFEWLFANQPSSWQELMVYATKKTHEEWSRQAREEHRRRREAEDPAERDYRIWRQIRDMGQSLDPGSWSPFSNDYPGPRYDPSGNIIPRHTGYSGCS